jgi:hypothetical protein
MRNRGAERERETEREHTYFDRLVPAAGCHNASLNVYPLDDLDGRVMLCDLLSLAGGDVEQASSVVSACREDLVAFL